MDKYYEFVSVDIGDRFRGRPFYFKHEIQINYSLVWLSRDLKEFLKTTLKPQVYPMNIP